MSCMSNPLLSPCTDTSYSEVSISALHAESIVKICNYSLRKPFLHIISLNSAIGTWFQAPKYDKILNMPRKVTQCLRARTARGGRSFNDERLRTDCCPAPFSSWAITSLCKFQFSANQHFIPTPIKTSFAILKNWTMNLESVNRRNRRTMDWEAWRVVIWGFDCNKDRKGSYPDFYHG